MALFGSLLTLVGVVVGALLSRNARAASELRDLRTVRYTQLSHNVHAAELAILELIRRLLRPDAYASRQAWTEGCDTQRRAVNQLTVEIRETIPELALFGSDRALDATTGLLHAFSTVTSSIDRGVSGPGACVSHWPDASAKQASERVRALSPVSTEVLASRRAGLVVVLRRDLGVDRRRWRDVVRAELRRVPRRSVPET